MTDQGVDSEVTYFATKTKLGLRPYHWSKYHALYGAREAKLAPDHIAAIEPVEEMARMRRELRSILRSMATPERNHLGLTPRACARRPVLVIEDDRTAV